MDVFDGGGRTPGHRGSLADAVSEQLSAVILGSDLEPGDRLPGERDLARRLQVSRIVIREALGRLEERGMIEIRPGVGTFVAPTRERSVTEPLGLYIRRSGVGIDHLFDLRHALEPAMVATAARYRTDDDLVALEATQARTVEILGDLGVRDGAVEAYAWADVAFHQQLAQASGNPLFEVLLVPLLEPLLDVRRDGARVPGAAAVAADEHGAVLRAVRDRDPEGARRAMTRHLHTVAGWLRSVRPAGGRTGRDDP